MKVVINKCYGGFGLSEAGYKKYAELKGITLYPEEGKFGLTTYWTVPKEDRVGILSDDEFYKASMEERKKSNKRCSALTIYCNDIERDDEYLVKVVEELGEKADGDFAELAVVNIPDGVEWEIDEYDGIESIHEIHRSWY